MTAAGDPATADMLRAAIKGARACRRSLTARPGPSHLSLALLAERPQQHKLVAFSGGTGFNSLCAELKKYTTHVAHVIPVSDDGGSTAEIVRVLGGCGTGIFAIRANALDAARSAPPMLTRRPFSRACHRGSRRLSRS